MKTLTAFAGILAGPVVGFCATYSLFYIRSLFHADCMWRLEACGVSLLLGAPIGLITFGTIGFWMSRRLDESLKQQISQEVNLGLECGQKNLPTDDHDAANHDERR